MEIIIKVVTIWLVIQGFTDQANGFQPNPQFGCPDQGQMQLTVGTVPKLLENPINRNNPGQGRCRSRQNPSMEQMSNSLSQKYKEFQTKYYPKSSTKRFDTH